MRGFLLLLLLTGCGGGWPPAGQGGMAEARWPAQLVDQHAPEGVEAHMRCTMSRLSATENVAHDRGTHTGAIAILDLTANRARREYTGGLYAYAQAPARLGVGDVVSITVPGEEAFANPFKIDREGHVDLPEVGLVDIAGLTVTQAKE